jgi:hypothetical protein
MHTLAQAATVPGGPAHENASAARLGAGLGSTPGAAPPAGAPGAPGLSVAAKSSPALVLPCTASEKLEENCRPWLVRWSKQLMAPW